MEHSESIETMAAERYALGEMTPEERDLFEEHFFDCRECAPSVRDAVSIGAATRLAPVKKAAAPRNHWWPAAAAAALVALLGYQNLVTIPHLRGDAAVRSPRLAAHVAHPLSLLMAESRDGSLPHRVVDRDDEVELDLAVVPDTPYPSYVAEIRDTKGKVRTTLAIAAEDTRETVTLWIPPGVLDTGKYEVVVSGVHPAKQNALVATYPFELTVR
jgi:hypothetical protein